MSRKMRFLIWVAGLLSFFSPWLASTGEAIPMQERMVINDQEIRTILVTLGYLPSTGIHSRTIVEKAVIAFQKDYGLDVDGSVGVKTQNAMLVRFLITSVPEIAARLQQMGQRFVCYVEGFPDPAEQDPFRRNYYRMVIGSDMRLHIFEWNRFAIRKDLSEIVLKNSNTAYSNEQYTSLDRWRMGK